MVGPIVEAGVVGCDERVERGCQDGDGGEKCRRGGLSAGTRGPENSKSKRALTVVKIRNLALVFRHYGVLVFASGARKILGLVWGNQKIDAASRKASYWKACALQSAHIFS